MIAYVFPGQGSQHAGMGQALAQQSDAAAEVFDIVDQALRFELSALLFGEDAAALVPTEIQQPAIFAHSMAALAALCERDPRAPAMVAGHSLGEYSAVTAAGSLGLTAAAKLVRRRGELMAAAGAQAGGAMAAVLSLSAEDVAALVAQASQAGVVAVANYNSPGQIVISGEVEAVAAARDLAKARGGKAIPLKVSGAFHSPLMAPAQAQLAPFIEEAGLRDGQLPVVSNVDASARTDAAGIGAALVAQVTGSVRWEESVRAMVAAGVDTFVELGPGTVLSKMIPRIAEGVRAVSVGTPAELDEYLSG